VNLTESQQRIQNSRLYALFWRWHFVTGFFAVPILVIAALTGAVITYQDEWHPLFYPHMDQVVPETMQVSLDEQVQAAKDAYPDIHIHGLIVYPKGSNHSNVVRFAFMDTGKNFWNPWDMGEVYVNPYNGQVLGMMDESQDVFNLITNLHKSFFLKLPGELAVDFATSWGVLSLLAGLYLWWPRRKEKVWGVWLPRFRSGRWIFLRDLHTVPSLYLTPTAVAVMVSGVLLGLSATPILLAEIVTRQFPTEFFSPKSIAPFSGQPASLDAILASMGSQPGTGPYSVGIPGKEDGAYMIQYGSHTDAINYRVTMVDQYSAKILADYTANTLPAGGRFYYLYIFNEVLHRGTYWGALGKALTFIACILVAVMCVTSWLMWWRRKPGSSWGIPKDVTDAEVPRWVKVTFILTAILLPMIGITMLMVMLWERIQESLQKRRLKKPSTT